MLSLRKNIRFLFKRPSKNGKHDSDNLVNFVM